MIFKYSDIKPGFKVGKFTAIRFVKQKIYHKHCIRHYWEYQCECGNIKIYDEVGIKKYCEKGCGYCKKNIEYVGKKYGRLIVLEQHINKEKHRTYCICLCDCGNIKEILIDKLKNGHTKSCGCLQKTHQMSKTSIYHTWITINQRCNNPKCYNFCHYGGRGIKCLWKNFEDFYKDMGDRPSSKHSIDRINVNDHYYKENCRWATQKEQNNNKRHNILVEYNGKKQTLMQWAEELGILYVTLWYRIKNNWPIEKVLTTKNYRKGENYVVQRKLYYRSNQNS